MKEGGKKCTVKSVPINLQKKRYQILESKALAYFTQGVS